MSLILFISLVNTFLWMIPIVRQFRSSYSMFFFVLGLIDIITVTFFYTFKILPIHTQQIMTFFLLPTLFLASKNKHILYLFLFVSISGIIFSFFYSNLQIKFLSILFVHIMLMSVFIKNIIEEISSDEEVNLFTLVLIFYELTLIFKITYLLFFKTQGPTFFYLTTALQIFIGLYFCLFTYKNSKKIRVNKSFSKNL